jgi:hypothetical protein
MDMEILAAVKLALRITTDAFDEELSDLIVAALLDMKLAGIQNADTGDPLVKRAVITYCRLNFGQPDDYDRLKKSYDEQKAQMGMASGYTVWTSQ